LGDLLGRVTDDCNAAGEWQGDRATGVDAHLTAELGQTEYFDCQGVPRPDQARTNIGHEVGVGRCGQGLRRYDRDRTSIDQLVAGARTEGLHNKKQSTGPDDVYTY